MKSKEIHGNPGAELRGILSIKFFSLTSFIILALIIGCSNPEKAFQEAKNENTINAYEKFIKEFPKSVKVDSAMVRIMALRPVQGKWVGNDIEFNISSDGIKITKLESKLENSASIILIVQTSAYRETQFLFDNIDIQNDGSFDFIKTDSYSQSTLKIEGNFTSSTEASGTFTFKNYGYDKLNGSTTWKAHPVK
ncbi:hypothetical protein ES708_14694 [subsurface metagenome]